MARPLRIHVAGGWYHVTARGQRRDVIFESDGDCRKFLELLEEMRDRYRVRVRAYCLMPNHYHLLLSTPDANLDRAMHWLNVSFSRYVSLSRKQVGPVFQGRYDAVLLEAAYASKVARYIHMNPVAVEALGLGKRMKQAEALGLEKAPVAVLRRRLDAVRRHKWSSYRAYAGYEKAPDWLDRKTLLEQFKGGETGYRQEFEEQMMQGGEETLGALVRWGLVLGSERFARKVRGKIRIYRESSEKTDLRKRRSFEELVRFVEAIKREKKAGFWDRYGDWGRDLVLWAGRRYGGLSLSELGKAAGGVDYSAVSMAIRRATKRAAKDRKLRKAMADLKARCEQ
jgi:REP element-mobilizing transposase RayT